MKKCLGTVLLFCLAAVLQAAETWTDSLGNTWQYNLSTGQKATITLVTPNGSFDGVLVVPAAIVRDDYSEPYPIVALDIAGFQAPQTLKDNLKSLTFEENSSVETIGGIGGCFAGCTNLETIVFPSSMKKIGKLAFSRCVALTSVTFAPGSVVTIEKQAFDRCTSLEHVVLPDTVKVIEERAFDKCSPDLVVELQSTGVKVGRDAIPGVCEIKIGEARPGDLAFAEGSSRPEKVIVTDSNMIVDSQNILLGLVDENGRLLTEPDPASPEARDLKSQLDRALSTAEVVPKDNKIEVFHDNSKRDSINRVFDGVPTQIHRDPNEPDNWGKVIFSPVYDFGISRMIWRKNEHNEDVLDITVRLMLPAVLKQGTELRLQKDGVDFGEAKTALEADGSAVFTVLKSDFWKVPFGTTRFTVRAVCTVQP